MEYVVGALIGLIAGGAGVFLLIQTMGKNALAAARTEGQQLKDNALKEAQNKAKELELSAKEDRQRLRTEFQKESEAERNELKQLDMRLTKREDVLDRKLDTLTVKERNLDELERKFKQRDAAMQKQETELSELLKEQRERLLQMTGMTVDQAKEM